PPGSRRSRGPRRSPTPTAPARDAVRGCRRSSSLAFPCQPPAQLVLEQLLLEQLEQQLVVDVVLPNISSRASTRSRTSKVSDSRSSSSPWSSDSALVLRIGSSFSFARRPQDLAPRWGRYRRRPRACRRGLALSWQRYCPSTEAHFSPL